MAEQLKKPDFEKSLHDVEPISENKVAMTFSSRDGSLFTTLLYCFPKWISDVQPDFKKENNSIHMEKDNRSATKTKS